jgi:hypothetical protein
LELLSQNFSLHEADWQEVLCSSLASHPRPATHETTGGKGLRAAQQRMGSYATMLLTRDSMEHTWETQGCSKVLWDM